MDEAVVLLMRSFSGEQEARRPIEQRVQIVWTRCHFGGFRHWFRCDRCGRRAAKLYLEPSGFAFACRLCHNLGYMSQLESPKARAITKARKLRMRLGGGPSVFEPPPGKPARMHWASYRRRLGAVFAAEERALSLQLDWLRTHYPGVTLVPYGPEPLTESV
jgi:hypothetical protein